MARRTGQELLDAIEPTIAAREDFLGRLKSAEGDAVRCADMMAEAIGMQRDSNSKDVVGRDGRKVVAIEYVVAAHCLFAARDAYLRARGSNAEPFMPALVPKLESE